NPLKPCQYNCGLLTQTL
ncbi:hypothetical protein AB1N83_012818, partial [Pleurotus pulmonarius]